MWHKFCMRAFISVGEHWKVDSQRVLARSAFSRSRSTVGTRRTVTALPTFCSFLKLRAVAKRRRHLISSSHWYFRPAPFHSFYFTPRASFSAASTPYTTLKRKEKCRLLSDGTSERCLFEAWLAPGRCERISTLSHQRGRVHENKKEVDVLFIS